MNNYYFTPTQLAAERQVKRVPSVKGEWKFIKKVKDGYVIGKQKSEPMSSNVYWKKQVK